jgi:hypothetical protein
MSQAASDPGARAVADRHELAGVLHRHPAGRGHAGTHPHPDRWPSGWTSTVGRQDIIVLLIGMVSAIVDNVPLVAASMGMYDLASTRPTTSCGSSWPTAPAPAAPS